jgi:hypothetical protein
MCLIPPHNLSHLLSWRHGTRNAPLLQASRDPYGHPFSYKSIISNKINTANCFYECIFIPFTSIFHLHPFSIFMCIFQNNQPISAALVRVYLHGIINESNVHHVESKTCVLKTPCTLFYFIFIFTFTLTYDLLRRGDLVLWCCSLLLAVLCPCVYVLVELAVGNKTFYSSSVN